MEQFNIYIETSTTGPAYRRAAGIWLIEHEKADGVMETKDGILYRDKISEYELTLQCMINAFFILNRTGVKTGAALVFTECSSVFNTMNNHWLSIWEKNGWNNAKGKPAPHRELWQQLWELMGNHVVSVTKESHSYKEIYMKEALRKELERREDGGKARHH